MLLPALLLWAGVILVGNASIELQSLSPGMRIMLHPYTLEFIIGALAAISIHTGSIRQLPTTFIWLIIACILLGGVPAVYGSDVLMGGVDILRAGLLGIIYGTLIFALTLLEQRKVLPVPRSLQFVGDVSYTIYLSHVLVLSVIGRLWLLAGPAANSRVDNLAVATVMLAAVIAYGWVGYRLVERPTVDFSHHLRARWRKSK